MKIVSLPILFFVILIVTVCFSSCRRTTVSNKTLLLADSLMLGRPDSALKLLEALPNPQLLPPGDKAEYALLLSRAKGKNGVIYTDDSLLLAALDYYEGGSDKEREAKAHYYLGRTYQNTGDDLAAIGAFWDAIGIMPEEMKTLYLGSAYEQLGYCYKRQNFYDKAIESYHLSYDLHLKHNNKMGQCNALIGLATSFIYQNTGDSALYYTQEALRVAQEYGNERFISSASFNLARVYYLNKDFRKAYQYISRSVEVGKNYSYDMCIYNCWKGMILAEMGQFDSAHYYLNYGKAIPGIMKIYAYTYFSRMEKSMKHWEKFSCYTDSLIQCYDSIILNNNHEMVGRMINRHELELQKSKSSKHVQQVLWISIVVCLSVAFSLIILFMYFDKKRKKRYIVLQKELMQNRGTFVQIDSVAEEDIVTNTVCEEPESQMDKLRDKSIHICFELFRSTNAYKKILDLEKKMGRDVPVLSLSERNDISETIYETFADVMLYLKKQSPALTTDDLLYCIFLLLGCDKSVILACVSVSDNAFRMRKKRINDKIGDDLFQWLTSSKMI